VKPPNDSASIQMGSSPSTTRLQYDSDDKSNQPLDNDSIKDNDNKVWQNMLFDLSNALIFLLVIM
jgi:hypothetical protein